jgi:NAD-dependent deacetylase
MATLPEKALIDKAADLIRGAQFLVVLTGAGVSAESGVPTFRDKDGLWDKYDVTTLATLDAFLADPAFVWKWYDWRRTLVAKVAPNAAHDSIAKLEARAKMADKGFALITQNIDNLHRLAGSTDPIELHGNIWKVRCLKACRKGAAPFDLLDAPLKEIPPLCPHCGGLLRPHIVWFGEMLEPENVRRSFDAAAQADVMIVVGTSNLVYPSAALPYHVMESGGKVVEVNMGKTGLSGDADVVLTGKAGEILPKLVG